MHAEPERDAAEQERELAICSVPASSRTEFATKSRHPPKLTIALLAHKDLL